MKIWKPLLVRRKPALSVHDCNLEEQNRDVDHDRPTATSFSSAEVGAPSAKGCYMSPDIIIETLAENEGPWCHLVEEGV